MITLANHGGAFYCASNPHMKPHLELPVRKVGETSNVNHRLSHPNYTTTWPAESWYYDFALLFEKKDEGQKVEKLVKALLLKRPFGNELFCDRVDDIKNRACGAAELLNFRFVLFERSALVILFQDFYFVCHMSKKKLDAVKA
jgi:hypothetical protein